MIRPFWSEDGTSPQDTMMEVDDSTTASTLTGGLAGTAQREYLTHHMWLLSGEPTYSLDQFGL